MNTTNLIGPIMADIAGLELTSEDRRVLRHPLVGGVILFTRNYRDRAQLQTLCNELRALKKPRLLIAVDHEGGRVQRFRDGFTAIPPMRELGMLFERDPAAARKQARELGATIGRELAAFGIDLCFAPVLDIDNGLSKVIGNRAFAGDTELISTLARAFSAGLADAGMAATGKHFPGHGAVVADSHLELPVDSRAFAEIEATELAPFQALIADGIPSLMMAHVRYTEIDQTPASLSKIWIASYLRRILGYRGAVFCDDLSMGGAAAMGGMKERALMALSAGCDMLPVCNDRPALLQLLKDLRGLKPSPAKSARLKKLYLQSAR
jgi:beta-N-acetylhexosaminidase